MTEPFVGSEAVARGMVSRHQLRTQYRAVLPNIYLCRQTPLSLQHRVAAAWLWSGRRGVIAGTAAAALHGAKWIDDEVDIELIHANPHPPRGVVTRRDVLLDDEMQILAGRAVTTAERTAFDIGRRAPRRIAVAQLDALARATGFKLDEVFGVAARHRGARGLRQLETVLASVDAGAQSPRETYLRLHLVEAGLPRPLTQIPVPGGDGLPIAYLDRAGRITWLRSNTTATIIASTDINTSKTFAGWSCWKAWDGSSSGGRRRPSRRCYPASVVRPSKPALERAMTASSVR